MKKLRILSGGAAQGLVEALRPAFEAESGCTIDGTFGAVGAMRARLLGGEPADLVILTRALIDGWRATAMSRRRRRPTSARSTTAIAVRQRRRPAAGRRCRRVARRAAGCR